MNFNTFKYKNDGIEWLRQYFVVYACVCMNVYAWKDHAEKCHEKKMNEIAHNWFCKEIKRAVGWNKEPVSQVSWEMFNNESKTKLYVFSRNNRALLHIHKYILLNYTPATRSGLTISIIWANFCSRQVKKNLKEPLL